MLAGAPISWGVCEVPGWGHQMSPERVLREIREAGLGATELGPPGFLPAKPGQLSAALEREGLGLAGGFVAAVLHRPERRQEALGAVERTARTLGGVDGGVLVVAAAREGAGYDEREPLSEGDWEALAESLVQLERLAGEHGVRLAVHPHVGTVIERTEEVRRLLELTDAPICLDTGHLTLGGADPVEVAERAGGRVVHVHLKDVDSELGRQVRAGRLSYSEAVAAGLYRPLGHGEVDLRRLLEALERSAYRGWYVLEQDVVLAAEPAPGEGPIHDVRRSLEFLARAAQGSGGVPVSTSGRVESR